MKRKAALRVALVALSLACLLFFLAGALSDCAPQEHDCHGEGCFLCLCCSLAEHVAALLSLFGVSFACLLLPDKNGIYHEAERNLSAATPVCLKVKLSD